MIAGRRNFPDVAAVNIVLIRGVDNFLPIRARGDVLHFEVSRREKFRGPAGDGNRPKMIPPAALPRENDTVARSPDQLIFGNARVIDAASARIGVPDFL